MKNKFFIFILSVLMLLHFVQLAEASGRKLGTSGAAELTIPMGVGSVGLSGSNIADVKGMDAIYWNPAGLSQLSSTEASFSYMDYFAGMKISYFTVGAKLGAANTIGISLQAMNIGDIPVTTIQNPEGTGENISPNFITLGLTYARQMTDRINFGVNGKVISEKIDDMSAMAVAFDFGLQYVTPFGFSLGVVMRNFGSSIEYSGTNVEFNSDIPWAAPSATTRKTALDMASHELPASLTLGAGYYYELGNVQGLNVSTAYVNNSYNNDQMSFGLEYNFKKMIFGRIGYISALFEDETPEGIDDYPYGLSFGIGANVNVGGARILVDYAYRAMDTFDANQYFGIGFAF